MSLPNDQPRCLGEGCDRKTNCQRWIYRDRWQKGKRISKTHKRLCTEGYFYQIKEEEK